MTSDFNPKLLLVTTKADIATDYVVLKLNKLDVPFYRLNTEDFPLVALSTVQINSKNTDWLWTSSLHKNISLDNLKCIWYRRHRLPMMPTEMSDAHADYCLRETEWFLKGAINSRSYINKQIVWMSHPLNIQRAESKIYQLSIAKELGLQIPDTVISNDAKVVRDFFHQKSGRIIAKPLRLGYFDYGDRQTSVYTSPVSLDDLTNEVAIKVAPVIYQELLPKKYDIRVTVVGNQVFAAAIDSQSHASSLIDWRKTDTEALEHFVHVLPHWLEQACVNLVNELGLSYGAIDFVLTPDNNYIFLEINPNGQWAWLEDKLQLPISEAISNWLYKSSQ